MAYKTLQVTALVQAVARYDEKDPSLCRSLTDTMEVCIPVHVFMDEDGVETDDLMEAVYEHLEQRALKDPELHQLRRHPDWNLLTLEMDVSTIH